MSIGGRYLQDPTNGTQNDMVSNRVPVTVPTLHRMKADGVPIASLTAYDYTMAVQVNDIRYPIIL